MQRSLAVTLGVPGGGWQVAGRKRQQGSTENHKWLRLLRALGCLPDCRAVRPPPIIMQVRTMKEGSDAETSSLNNY